MGQSGGRPKGTTIAKGYKIGKAKRKLIHTLNALSTLPTTWDTSAVNLDPDLLKVCSRRIQQQRTFDRKPLGVGVCYACGHVLWSCVDGAHTFLVDKPPNMTVDDAPASAYLRAVPNCTLSFEYKERGSSTKERWYCCSHCKSDSIPTDQHVGHVLGKILLTLSQ